ncbi:alpha/beta fold hydrolase [Micropruina sp.]|uniref:alpha/beta fold hydrolase n=1 Tax=Micropruina sp. TaxID=2737536 RepID=UPI0039E4407C
MSVPLLVFLHGLGQTPQFWQNQVTVLPSSTRAVAPWLDGLRPGSSAGFELERAADAVLTQLNRFGVDQVALVGSGLGSSVAVAAAGRSPAAVSHLVLSDVLPRTPRLAGALQRLAMRAMPAATLADAGLDRERMLALMRTSAAIDLRPLLPEVTAQTLVVGGSGNPSGVTAGRELAAAIAGARCEVVGRAGSGVPAEAPEEFNRLLYEFSG